MEVGAAARPAGDAVEGVVSQLLLHTNKKTAVKCSMAKIGFDLVYSGREDARFTCTLCSTENKHSSL